MASVMYVRMRADSEASRPATSRSHGFDQRPRKASCAACGVGGVMGGRVGLVRGCRCLEKFACENMVRGAHVTNRPLRNTERSPRSCSRSVSSSLAPLHGSSGCAARTKAAAASVTAPGSAAAALQIDFSLADECGGFITAGVGTAPIAAPIAGASPVA